MARIPNRRDAGILGILIGGEQYGRAIRREYEARYGEQIPFGSLYVVLGRLEEKGLVKSRFAESTHERGGNRRKYFTILGKGVKALKAFHAHAIVITTELGVQHG